MEGIGKVQGKRNRSRTKFRLRLLGIKASEIGTGIGRLRR
jgi:hypothetical protein